MLKLMRLEKTSVFAIVDDVRLESEIDVLGYVHMDLRGGKHVIKIFESYDDVWFDELENVIKEKERILRTDAEYMKHTLNLENIVVQYLREKGSRYVKIGVIKNLVNLISVEIYLRDLFFEFWDYDQLDENNVLALLESSEHLIVDGDDIRIKSYFSDIICFNPSTDVDFKIREIIVGFISKEKRKVV